MSAIGKGDWLQCLKSEPASEFGGAVTAGGVYFCEGLERWRLVVPCGDCGADFGSDSSPALVLSGVTNPGCGWCPCTFKPLGGNARSETRKAPAELEPA